MNKSYLIIIVAIGLALGGFVFLQDSNDTNITEEKAKPYPEKVIINAPISQQPPAVAKSTSARHLSSLTKQQAKHASHPVPPAAEQNAADQRGQYSQSLPHGHENPSTRGRNIPPGEPLKENSTQNKSPLAPAR
jgi:uncharacterized protein HemX